MISFTSIPFGVVKLKNFVPIQHPCWVHFGGVFCLFLLNMWSNFGQTLTPKLLLEDGRNWKKTPVLKKTYYRDSSPFSGKIRLFYAFLS